MRHIFAFIAAAAAGQWFCFACGPACGRLTISPLSLGGRLGADRMQKNRGRYFRCRRFWGHSSIAANGGKGRYCMVLLWHSRPNMARVGSGALCRQQLSIARGRGSLWPAAPICGGSRARAEAAGLSGRRKPLISPLFFSSIFQFFWARRFSLFRAAGKGKV